MEMNRQIYLVWALLFAAFGMGASFVSAYAFYTGDYFPAGIGCVMFAFIGLTIFAGLAAVRRDYE